jgi:hypothetical protein
MTQGCRDRVGGARTAVALSAYAAQIYADAAIARGSSRSGRGLNKAS